MWPSQNIFIILTKNPNIFTSYSVQLENREIDNKEASWWDRAVMDFFRVVEMLPIYIEANRPREKVKNENSLTSWCMA